MRRGGGIFYASPLKKRHFGSMNFLRKIVIINSKKAWHVLSPSLSKFPSFRATVPLFWPKGPNGHPPLPLPHAKTSCACVMSLDMQNPFVYKKGASNKAIKDSISLLIDLHAKSFTNAAGPDNYVLHTQKGITICVFFYLPGLQKPGRNRFPKKSCWVFKDLVVFDS